MGFRLRRFISRVNIEARAVRLLIPDNTCWPAERAIRRPAAAYIDLQVGNVLSLAMALCPLLFDSALFSSVPGNSRTRYCLFTVYISSQQCIHLRPLATGMMIMIYRLC